MNRGWDERHKVTRMAIVLPECAGAARAELKQRHSADSGAMSPAARASRVVRSAGQVALFAYFGLSGALLTAIVVPAFSLFFRDPARRVRSVRGFVFQLMRTYVGSMRALRLIDLEVIGLDVEPAAGSLIVANHPSLIDALILLGQVRGAAVVAKRSLQVSPFTSGGIRGANYVVNTDAAALIEECRSRIAAGETLILFPECTRTATDGVIRLRRGAAHVAVRTGCPVIPVTIEFSEPLLTKESRWWLAPKVRPHVRVTRHPAMDPAQFLVGDVSVSLAARKLTEYLREFYVKELGRRGST